MKNDVAENEMKRVSYKRKIDDVKKLPYPQNLVETISEGRSHISFPQVITADMETGLFYAMCHLPDREHDMLLMRFQHGKTLEYIAKKYEITPNRVQQIIHKAIRRLAGYSLRKMYQNGMLHYINTTVDQIVDAKIGQLTKDEYERGYKEGYSDAEYERPSNPKIVGMDMPIEELGLSARPYNALIRAGNKTIGDLWSYTDYNEILRIRNAGAISLAEISRKLNKLGLINDVWKFWLPEEGSKND